MVEQIEEFGTELNYREFADAGVLDQREVGVLVTRPIQDVPARIAETAERRDGEGRRVEPALRRRVIQFGWANQVWPVVAQESEVRDAGVAVVEFGQERDRERAARLQRDHAVSLPSAEQRRGQSCIADQALSFPERQVVGITEREAMAHVEAGSPALGAQVKAVLRIVRIACAGEDARGVVDRFAIGVRAEQREAERQPLLQASL